MNPGSCGEGGETQLAKFTVFSLPLGSIISIAFSPEPREPSPAIAVVAREEPRLERLLLLPVPVPLPSVAACFQ